MEMADEFAFDHLPHLKKDDNDKDKNIENVEAEEERKIQAPNVSGSNEKGWEICLFYGITKFNRLEGE